MIIQFIVSLFATLSFAELFGAPKKELFFCGLTGAIGWVVYVIGLNSNMGTVLANLTATFALTVFSAYSVRDPQKSGNHLPHRRYFSALDLEQVLLLIPTVFIMNDMTQFSTGMANHQGGGAIVLELSLASVCRRAGLTHCSE